MRAARLTCSALAGLLITLTPATLRAAEPVDFERHVMGLFGKMGCNGGGCHGSFQGKGNFRLSLFGYDPEKDYQAVTRDAMGRRLDLVNPDRSLLLLKATGQVNHDGGVRFGKESWQYKILRDWVATGAPWKKGSGEVAQLLVTPPEYPFKGAGEKGQLLVQARYADGSVEDITRFCEYRTNDDAIADVTSLGEVRSVREGDTAIVVSYRGNVVPVRAMVPVVLPPGTRYPAVAYQNAIDREVFAKLQRLNIIPADLSSDLEFLRRVTIDTTGCLPTPDEVRAFLADPSPDKRARKIDQLLVHPLHAALWATKFSDITGNNTDGLENPQPLKAKRSQMWHDWIRKRVQDNVPYDQIVRGILTATSRDGLTEEAWIKRESEYADSIEKGWEHNYASKPTLDLFWRRQAQVPIEQWAEKTAAAFLGVRLECAQCHKHPFDRWTQVDYRSYANVFSQVTFQNNQFSTPEARKLATNTNTERRGSKNQNQVVQVRELFLGGRTQMMVHPDTNRALPAKAPGGPEITVSSGTDAREQLFQWMSSPDNPFFARSFANRVWGHYFGVGIVDPVDDFSLGNPPSNAQLLNLLAREFTDNKYDIRHLERFILNSRAYQLSSATNPTNRLDRRNYSHGLIRPMMAEVLVDVLNSGLGTLESYGNDGPPNVHAIEIGTSRFLDQRNTNMAYAFRIFGRPPRTTACDCERAADPALPQKLFLMTDPGILNKIQTGRLNKLLDGEMSDGEILQELFLATLTRLPTPAEVEVFETHRTQTKSRREAFEATLWALINTREFVLNH